MATVSCNPGPVASLPHPAAAKTAAAPKTTNLTRGRNGGATNERETKGGSPQGEPPQKS
jgi:hypothetical protein